MQEPKTLLNCAEKRKLLLVGTLGFLEIDDFKTEK